MSFCQVRWAQEISKYHFWIDYCQRKANGAGDALSHVLQQDDEEKANFWAENTQIIHCLQFSLTNASISGLNTMFSGFLPQHQVFICGTYVLPQLWRFWSTFWNELANERPYEASINSKRLRLQELQKANREAQELRQQKANSYEEINEIFYHQGLPFVLKAIWTELISRHHNNLLAGYFGIKKTRKFLAQKYYWLILHHNIEVYVKGCNLCLASKVVCHKPYSDLQLLPVLTHQLKHLLMDFMTGLPVSIHWKKDGYNSILVIVNWLTKMVNYKPVKITFNALGLAEVIIDVVVRHHGLKDSIITNRGSFFTSKFWSSLCYFLGIQRRLSTAFYLQTDSQTERQNSTMKAYLQDFINFEHNDWARLLPMAEFAYNNAKNSSTGHTPFKLNCGYHPCIFFEKNTDPRSQSKSANKLSAELEDLMTICQENLYHAQELQKRAYNKGVKSRNYVSIDKVWLNSKYSKTKCNQKLDAKFFRPFRVLHPVGKQVYKLEFLKWWRMHNVFHVSLLDQNTTRKERVDERVK